MCGGHISVIVASLCLCARDVLGTVGMDSADSDFDFISHLISLFA